MPYFGILDDHTSTDVPGTVVLSDGNQDGNNPAVHLKHANRKNKSIVLIPQPTASPADPLTWSSSRRASIMFVVLMGTLFYVCVSTTLLNAGAFVVASDFEVRLDDVMATSGEQLLVMGAAAPLGKRLTLGASSVLHLVGTIVCQTAPKFAALRAGRIVQGLALASTHFGDCQSSSKPAEEEYNYA